MSVAIYVQYLLGTGHLSRMLKLARGLNKNNIPCKIISGGIPLSYLNQDAIYQLPPIQVKDSTFSELVDSNFKPLSEDFKLNRKQQIISFLNQYKPEVLIVETYPFGRHMLSFEIIPMLDYIKSLETNPVCLSSIRDILNVKPFDNRKENRSIDLIQKYFDGVLVHSDETIVPFSKTFSQANQIRDKIVYTGYIAEDKNIVNEANRTKTILISTGGGRVGETIIKTALKLAKNGFLNDYHWHFLTGKDNRFSAKNSDNITIEKNRSDYLSLLNSATLSISQAGYNTVTDLFITKTPAILIPFCESYENEQKIRAEILNQTMNIPFILEETLSGDTLAQEILAVLNQKTAYDEKINTEGVKNTVNYIKTLL